MKRSVLVLTLLTVLIFPVSALAQVEAAITRGECGSVDIALMLRAFEPSTAVENASVSRTRVRETLASLMERGYALSLLDDGTVVACGAIPAGADEANSDRVEVALEPATADRLYGYAILREFTPGRTTIILTIPGVTALGSTEATLPAPVQRTAAPTDQSGQRNSPMSRATVDHSKVGGTALPLIPEGDPGQLSIVAVGPADSSSLLSSVPILLRNNTNENLARIGVSAVVTDSSGEMLGIGGDLWSAPKVVEPGGVVLITVVFDGVEIAADSQIEFTLDSTPQRNASFPSLSRDLEVLETSRIDSLIVGVMRNSTNDVVEWPFAVQSMCFDEAGNITSDSSGNVELERAEPGQEIPFQVNLWGSESQDCAYYLVAGYGFAD